MPLYEYQCDNCNEKFEVMQKFADEPLTKHEKCGGGPVHRLVSASAFNFKGSGWYVNDYAKKPKTTSGDSSSTSSSSDGPAKSTETSKETSKDTSKESKPSSDPPTKSSPSTPSSDTK